MQLRPRSLLAPILALASGASLAVSYAADQAVPGAGNATAAAIAAASPRVLPPLRKLGSVDLLAAGQTNVLAEYTIHNLSDGDFTYSGPAVADVQLLLANVAPASGSTRPTRFATTIDFAMWC